MVFRRLICRRAHLLVMALVSSFFQQANGAQTTSCTEFQETIQLLPELTMSYVMNVHDQAIGQGTLTVEAVLQKVGWLGIGFSQNGFMANSTAIVALPNEPVSDVNPAKYHITSSYDGGMKRDMKPSLTDANIQQNETTTVITFTIPLLRQGEIPIRANASNQVIFAYGYRNDLSYHADRDSVSIDFIPCEADDEEEEDLAVEKPTSIPPTSRPTVKVEEAPTRAPTSPNIPDRKEEQKHEDDVQSCLKFKNKVQLSPLLALDYVIKQYDNRDAKDYPDGIISAQLTYQGLGWIGFGVTTASGSMIPGEVVIGLPSEPLNRTNPGKYVLNGRGRTAVELLPQSSQTLIESTISQTDSTTILTFHKHLVETGELPINANGQTTFIWAHGVGNDLTSHADRGAFNLTLLPCNGSPTSQNQNSGSVTKVATSGSNKSLWTAHGVLAGIAWGVIAPLAVASTLLRDLFRNQKRAIKIHIVLNLVASLCTMAAFCLAIVARKKSNPEGERSKSVVAHQAVGLLIMIFTTFQVLVALFRPTQYIRPRVPDEEEMSYSYKVSPKKSGGRIAWEIIHKITGFAMVCIAWLQVYSGLTLYSEYFTTKYDWRLGFCAAVVAIAGITFVLSIYSIRVKRRSTVPVTITFRN